MARKNDKASAALAKPSPLRKALPANIDIDKILTPEERAEITKQARAKIEARDKLDAEEAFLSQELKRLDDEAHPEKREEMREIVIDLALYADRIILDGTQFFHGSRYTVPKSQYDVMHEIMARTWRHDDEIHSGEPGDNFYRNSRQMKINMATGAATAAGQPVRF